MKKIYNAPQALEIPLNTQDVITASPNEVQVEQSGDGMSATW